MEQFSFDTSASRFANNARASAPQLAVRGGDSKGGVEAAPSYESSSGPSNAIPQFFQTILGDRIAAIKQERFAQGFAAARAGKTVKEINEDTPWFATLFGQTDMEAGATVYTAQSAVAELGNKVTQEIDTLKTKTPEEMGQWLNEQQQALMTGDLLADAVIQKELLAKSGAIMDLQAKARFAWGQETLVKTQREAALSQGRVYHSNLKHNYALGQSHPNQVLSPEQTADQRNQFLQVFQPPAGQTYESTLDFYETTVQGLAREGQWHAVKAFMDSGIVEQLPVENQERIAKNVATASSKWLTTMEADDSMQDAYKILASASAGVISPQMTYNAMTDFNRKFTAQTGYPGQYFSNDEIQSAVKGNAGLVFQAHQRKLDALDREKEKAKDAADKEAAEARADASYAKDAAMGTLGVTRLMSNYDNTRAEAALRGLWDQNPTRGLQALELNFTNKSASFVSQTLKDRFKQQIEAGAGLETNNAMAGVYATYEAMFDHGEHGPALANAYFGEYADDMFTYRQMIQGGVDPTAAYTKVFGPEAQYGAGDLRGGAGFKENDAALRAAVDDISPGWFAQMFGGEEISQSAKDMIAHHSSRQFARLTKQASWLGPQRIAQQSVQFFLQNGGEVAGKYAWQNGPRDKRIADELRIPQDVFGGVFDTAVTNKMRKAGLKVDKDTAFEIVRIPSDAAGPRMLITGYSNDGTMKAITLNGEDFAKYRDEYSKQFTEDTSKEGLQQLGKSSGRNY